jgi:hypothetical protein
MHILMIHHTGYMYNKTEVILFVRTQTRSITQHYNQTNKHYYKHQIDEQRKGKKDTAARTRIQNKPIIKMSLIQETNPFSFILANCLTFTQKQLFYFL